MSILSTGPGRIQHPVRSVAKDHPQPPLPASGNGLSGRSQQGGELAKRC